MADRRDVLKALAAALPGVATVERLDARPGDVIVLKASRRLSLAEAEVLQRQCDGAFAGVGVRVVVLQEGLDIAVLRKEDR